MRKAILFLCVGVLSLISLTSFAQLRLGVKAGISTTSVGLHLEDSDDEKTYRDALKLKLGFSAGLAAEYNFTNALSLQTGLHFTKKGFRIKSEEGFNFEKRKTTLSYLGIPIHLAFKVSKFQVHAGPYVGFGLAGKSKYDYRFAPNEFEIYTGNEYIKYKFKNKLAESDLIYMRGYLRQIDIGLNLGIGYQAGPVLVTATYAKGLSNLYPKYDGDNEDGDKITNKGFGLAITWFFLK